MGSGKRSLTTVTMALACACACACAVLVTSGPAYASPTPTPTSTRTTSPDLSLPPTSPTSVSNKELEAVRTKLDTLYHSAAVATDAYNAAEEKVKEQSAQIVGLAREIVEGQERLDDLKDLAGAAARAQYRSGGLTPEAQLWLSEDPQEFLDGAGRVRQGEHATEGLLAEMTRTQQDLEQYAKDASAQWTKLESNREAKDEAKKKVKQQIAAAEKLESQLEADEKARLAKLEEEAAYQAQTTWLNSGVTLGSGETSAQGKKAVAYATAQIGKAYEWGAEGPKTYDCSGLTSQAWASMRRRDSAHLAGAVEAAHPHRHQGHAPRRSDHLLRRRQPCRDVHRRRRHGARSPARAHGDDRGRGFDADPGGRASGRVTRDP